MLSNTPSNHRHVAIILCTYNPHLDYFSQQLLSLENQTYRNFDLIINDDGSDIGTYKKMKEIVSSIITRKFILKRNQTNLGFAQNFIQTLNSIKNYKYYSFCDQDDIWYRDKLSKSVRDMNKCNLYCTSTRLIDDVGNVIGLNKINIKPSFKNALVQSIAGGNTYLFDNKIKNMLLKIPQNKKIPSHDWIIYQLATAHDLNIIYNQEPSIDYRLHNTNTIGTSFSLRAKYSRIRSLLFGKFRKWTTQNIKILLSYESTIKKENVYVLKTFLKKRDGNLFKRMSLFTKYLFRRSTNIQNIAFLLGLILKKI